MQERIRKYRRLQTLKKRTHDRALQIKRKLKRVVKRATHLFMSKEQRCRQIFEDVYKDGLWGSDQESRFFSGVGSRGGAVDTYVEKMTVLIQRYAAELGRSPVIVDLGCGDFQVGNALLSRLPDITYVGCDIVPELIAHNNQSYGTDRISFRHVDIVVDPLPAGDICLVRQVLQHLSNEEISNTMRRMGRYKLIYVTEGHRSSASDRSIPIRPRGPMCGSIGRRDGGVAWSSTAPLSTRRSWRCFGRSHLRMRSLSLSRSFRTHQET